MEYIRPHYYNDFSCIASECEDTCCAGWQIAIDRKSMSVYQQVAGGFGNRLHNCIDWDEEVFERDYETGRCAFLNDKNLCDIYAELGEEYLCQTCREFPRHIEEYEGVREESLSLACPVAAALILSQTEPVTFDYTTTEEEDDEWDFDFLFFTKIMDAREYLFSLMQNRKLSVESRIGIALKYSSQLHTMAQDGCIFAMDDLTQDYKSRKVKATPLYKSRKKKLKQYFSLLKQLEVLKPEWPEWVKRCEDILYTKDEVEYEKDYKEFTETVKLQSELDFEIIREQLMVYYIFIYFGGSVYDGEILPKIKMAVWGTELIYEMCFAKWLLQGKTLSFHDVTEIAWRFSKEVEHSDVNLDIVEGRWKD